jgi:hypothetical protein
MPFVLSCFPVYPFVAPARMPQWGFHNSGAPAFYGRCYPRKLLLWGGGLGCNLNGWWVWRWSIGCCSPSWVWLTALTAPLVVPAKTSGHLVSSSLSPLSPGICCWLMSAPRAGRTSLLASLVFLRPSPIAVAIPSSIVA